MPTTNLGKVSIRPCGEWSIDNPYDILDLVAYSGGSYLSKKIVPPGIQINNEVYWMPIAATHETVLQWLEEHPEATTTVQDGSVTKAKLFQALSDEITQHGTDINMLSSRIDEIIDLPDGSTTGDAQLADIKIGWDGRTYSEPGVAVRNQLFDVNGVILSRVEFAFEGGSITAATGTDLDNYRRIRSKYYMSDESIMISTNNDMQINVFAYDDAGNYVGVWNPETQAFGTVGVWSTRIDLRTLRNTYDGHLRFRVSARKSDDSDIRDIIDECGNSIMIYRSKFADVVEPEALLLRDVAEYAGNIVKMPDGAEWHIGHLINASGVDRDSDPESPHYTADAKYYATTDYYAPRFTRVYNSGKLLDADGKPMVLWVHEYTFGQRWLRRTQMTVGGYVDLQPNTGYIRFVFGHAAILNVEFTEAFLPLFSAFGVIKAQTDITIYADAYSWTIKHTIDANGNEVQSSTYFCTTDYIDASAAGYIWTSDKKIQRTVSEQTLEYDPVCFVHEYDADKRWIQRTQITQKPCILTSDTRYVRFVCGRLKSTKKEAGQATSGEIAVFEVTPLTKNDVRNLYTESSDLTLSWGKSNMLANASQMLNIAYTPIRRMPTQVDDGYFPANVEIKGLPYSSARAYNKMVGIDVSFHTFMSAISNPRSVLYTRRLRTRNAGTYYGVVCSVLDDYAMGLPFNVTTAFFRKWNILEKHPYTAIEIGDFLVNSKHTILITDCIRDKWGRIQSISYMEAITPIVRTVKDQAWDTFRATREDNEDPYGVYRYPKQDDVQYTPSPFVQCFDEDESEDPVVFPDIMSEYGDHAVMLEGESTVINVLSTEGYTNIIVKNGGTSVFETTTLADFSLNDLTSGNYDIIITDSPNSPEAETAHTSTSYIHVVGCNCSFNSGTKVITFTNYGDAVPTVVNYSCGYYFNTPRQYDVINDIKILTDDDISAGSVNVSDLNPEPNPKYTVHGNVDYWASVIFQTPWGSATWRSHPFDGVWDAEQSIYEPMPVQWVAEDPEAEIDT